MAEKPPDRREQSFYFALAQVGMEMIVPIGIGLALDHYLSWRPWGAIGGTALGFVGGLYHLVALVQQHDRGDDQNSSNSE